MSSSKSHSRRPWWSTLGIYAGLSLAAFIMVIPLLFSFVTAFKSPQDFASHSPFALPSPPSLASFQAILTGRVNFGDAIITTLLMVVVMVVGQLVSSVLAAYAFARIEFPGREVIFWLFLGTMMARMGLNNTFWGIVLPFVFASPYAVFLLRQSFRQIPQEIIDAATMDGAGQIRILFSIVVPVSKPIISTLVLITVVSQWNSFMWPRIIAATRPRVLTVATAALQSQYNANWTYVMAATTIALVPLIALFIVFQRHIVESIALTGIK